ncbi:MAG: hypothetical protein MUF54_06390 [Polyangiaceae bacterium]|jgi:hypothetical protein|nr:hypothetical protein [Polyangiaceae bacterium]
MSLHKAVIVMFPYEAGGRPVMPEGSGYSPHACTENGQEFLPVTVHNVPANACFNTEFEASIEFRYPNSLDYSPIMQSDGFRLVEGPKTVGRARIVIVP